MITPKDWADFAQEFHSNATNKGWHEKDDPLNAWRQGSWVALFHSEVSEAVEDDINENDPIYFEKGSKPCGWLIELADVVIRVLDVMVECGYNVEQAMSRQGDVDVLQEMPWASFSRIHAYLALHCACSRLLEAMRHCRHTYRDFVLIISVCVLIIGDDERLREAMNVKHAYNTRRSYKHGGKTL